MAGNKNSGRKPIDNPAKMRTRRLTIKLSPVEFTAWERAAGPDTLSDFVRSVVNSTLNTQGVTVKEMPQ